MINAVIYSLTFCYSKSRSSPCNFILGLFSNVFSSLIVLGSFCNTKNESIVWLLLSTVSYIMIFSIVAFRIFDKFDEDKILPTTIWDLNEMEDSVDEYVNSVYDNPPIFTMKFTFGSNSKNDPDCNIYYANVRYGSWELSTERNKFEHNKSTVVVISKSDYEPVSGFDRALQDKINLTVEILTPYDRIKGFSGDPDIEYSVFNIDEKGKVYSTSCFFKFMRSIPGRIFYLLLSLFGFDVILENICWLYSDVIYIDNVRKVSPLNDLDVPAFTVRGKNKPVLTATDDKLPSCLNTSQYYQISDNQKISNIATNTETKVVQMTNDVQETRSTLGQSLIDTSNETPKNFDDDIPLQQVSPLIPNSRNDANTNNQNNPYSSI